MQDEHPLDRQGLSERVSTVLGAVADARTRLEHAQQRADVLHQEILKEREHAELLEDELEILHADLEAAFEAEAYDEDGYDDEDEQRDGDW